MPYTQIIFDTDCVLCSGMVQFVLRHERAPTLQFVSAWSPTGLAIAGQHGFSKKDLDQTYLVIEEGNAFTKSEAGLRILNHLNAPVSWLRIMRIVPRPLRDGIYDFLARRRYQWFGHRPQCFIPPPGSEHRFIDN